MIRRNTLRDDAIFSEAIVAIVSPPLPSVDSFFAFQSHLRSHLAHCAFDVALEPATMLLASTIETIPAPPHVVRTRVITLCDGWDSPYHNILLRSNLGDISSTSIFGST